jgi:hypothetical protein
MYCTVRPGRSAGSATSVRAVAHELRLLRRKLLTCARCSTIPAWPKSSTRVLALPSRPGISEPDISTRRLST